MVFEVVLIMAEKALTEAVGLFEEKMAQGRYKEAAKIREDHSLPLDMLRDAVTKEYSRVLGLGEYSLAADLAKEYSLSEKLIRMQPPGLSKGR